MQDEKKSSVNGPKNEKIGMVTFYFNANKFKPMGHKLNVCYII